MELVDLFGKRESIASIVNPADLEKTLREGVLRRGVHVVHRTKRRASGATRIGKYTDPAPETVFQVDHPSQVVSVAIYHPEKDERGLSSGESFVASGCENGEIHILSLLTGQRRSVIRVHTDIVTCLRVYQPQSSSLLVLVSGSADRTIQVTVVESGLSTCKLVGHSKEVLCLDIIEQDGFEPIIVSGGLDGKVCIWSMVQRELLKTLQIDAGPVYCLAVVSASSLVDGAPLVFAGYGDRRVRLWSLETGRVLKEFAGHPKRITCLAVLNPLETASSVDGTDCAPVSVQYVQKLVKALEEAKKEADEAREKCCGSCGSCCASCCASCRPDHIANKKIEAITAELSEFNQIKRMTQEDLNVLSRDMFLLTGSEDGCVRIFHTTSVTLVRVIDTKQHCPVHSMAFTLKETKQHIVDGEPMLAVGSKNGVVQIWHLDTGRLMRTFQQHAAPIMALGVTTNTSNIRAASTRIEPTSVVTNEPKPPVGAAGGGGDDDDNDDGDNDGRAVNSAAPVISPSPKLGGFVNVLVTAGGDRSVRIRQIRTYFEEALDCYMLDQRERLPRSEMNIVPDAFSKWPRVYLLSRKLGTMDEFFSGANFELFNYAMEDDRLDFISTFLPHAHTGLLIGSRKSAIRRFYDEAYEILERRRTEKATNDLWRKASWLGPLAHIAAPVLFAFQILFFSFKRMHDPNQHACHMEELRRSSLLFKAVERKNVLVVRIVLDAWLRLLQTPPRDLLDQSAGPAMCLSKRDLIHVAEVFPSEFERFVCSLSLIAAHPAIAQGCTYNLSPGKVRREKGSLGSFKTDVTLWKGSDDTGQGSQEPYTCMYLPLRQACDLDMVEAYVKTCARLNSLKIFSSDVGVTTNHYSWGAVSMRVHGSAFLWYMLDCVIFLIYVFSTRSPRYALPLLQVGATVLIPNAFTIHGWCTAYQVTYAMARFRNELQQFFFSGGTNFIAVFASPWTIFDLFWQACRISSSSGNAVMLAISSLLQWVRLMYYLRAFESTGLLVAMILRIVSEIKFYLCVIFIVVLFFSESLWVLSSADLSKPFSVGLNEASTADDGDDATRFANTGNVFGDQASALMTSFTFLFGNFQPAFFGNIPSSWLRRWAVFISVIMMLTVVVLMFNLLIAFMSDIFVRMSQEGRSQWRLMQAKTIFESGYTISVKFHKIEDLPLLSPKLIHVLRRTSDMTLDSLKNSLENSDAGSLSETILKSSNKTGSELAKHAIDSEKEMLQRLAVQQSNLEAMIAQVEEITRNPTNRKRDESMSSSVSAGSATPERRGIVRL